VVTGIKFIDGIEAVSQQPLAGLTPTVTNIPQ
jgi:hypothetical protein